VTVFGSISKSVLLTIGKGLAGVLGSAGVVATVSVQDIGEIAKVAGYIVGVIVGVLTAVSISYDICRKRKESR
jgi:hypothetical protein